jgi:hypothetical protein
MRRKRKRLGVDGKPISGSLGEYPALPVSTASEPD